MNKLPFKAYRALQNMTQADVAEAVGVGRLTYASWERYETFPDAIQLIKLSEVFKCSLDAFYFPDTTS
jgi:transcriptional regulator with XRE-family HTH domain